MSVNIIAISPWSEDGALLIFIIRLFCPHFSITNPNVSDKLAKMLVNTILISPYEANDKALQSQKRAQELHHYNRHWRVHLLIVHYSSRSHLVKKMTRRSRVGNVLKSFRGTVRIHRPLHHHTLYKVWITRKNMIWRDHVFNYGP